MMKACPDCGLTFVEGAKQCRCGFAFGGESVSPKSRGATNGGGDDEEGRQQGLAPPADPRQRHDAVNTSPTDEAPGTQGSEPASVASGTSGGRLFPVNGIRPDNHVGLRLPILRVTTGLLRGGVLAIYETHLLKGTRYLLPLRLTEEMCHAVGEPSLKRVLHWSRRIENLDIQEIREESDDPRKEDPKPSLFTIRVRGLRQLRLSIPALQVKNVRAALASRFADRYLVRQMKAKPGNLPLLLILVGVVPMICSLLSIMISMTFIFVSALLAGAGLISTCMGWDFPFYRGKWKSINDWSPPTIKRAIPREPGLESRRSPTSSLPLGWTLKLLGVVYWFIIVCPFGAMIANDERLRTNLIVQNFTILINLPSPLLIYAGYRLCQRRYDPARKTNDAQADRLLETI